MTRTPSIYSKKAEDIPPLLKAEMPSSDKSTNDFPSRIWETTVAISHATINDAAV